MPRGIRKAKPVNTVSVSDELQPNMLEALISVYESRPEMLTLNDVQAVLRLGEWCREMIDTMAGNSFRKLQNKLYREARTAVDKERD